VPYFAESHRHHHRSKFQVEAMKNVIRSSLVLLTVLIGLGVPKFNLITNLVGGFSNNLVAIILPSLFYIRLFKDELSTPIIALNVGIMVLGICAGILSTWLTITEIVKGD
jgi:hypothetical protein